VYVLAIGNIDKMVVISFLPLQNDLLSKTAPKFIILGLAQTDIIFQLLSDWSDGLDVLYRIIQPLAYLVGQVFVQI
jgi:hypothetical protein